MENGDNKSGILAVNAQGEILGFRFKKETPTGTKVIVSEPAGATIAVSTGDSTLRTAPARFENVPRGEYEFTIRKKSYQRVDTTLSVEAYRSTTDTIEMTPNFGYLSIDSNPDTVRVDGVKHSFSKEEPIRVGIGERNVTLSKRYYQTHDTTLTVRPGQTEVISTELQRKRGELRVFSDPRGALVIMDGDTVGTTPLRTRRKAGRSYSFRVTAEGYVPSERMELFIEPDSAVEQDVTLSAVKAENEGSGMRIENVRAQRSSGLVTIKYDLFGKPGEMSEVIVSLIRPDKTSIHVQSEAVRGAIGEGIKPGSDKKIYWRETIPEGATLLLTPGSPSVVTSLTVGMLSTDFRPNGGGPESPFSFERPLRTFMFSGRNGSFLVGYDKFATPQGAHRALNISLGLGGNVHILRPSWTLPSLIYIPIRLRGNYLYTDPSFDLETDITSLNALNLGLGAGLGSRFRIGRFPGLRDYPVIRSLVLEGSLMYTPGGFQNLKRGGFMRSRVSRMRDMSVEVRLVDLLDTGVGGNIGFTFGFTNRMLSRSSQPAANLGEVLEVAFGAGEMDRISTQQVFRFGINWE